MENLSFAHVTIKSPRTGIVMTVATVAQACEVLEKGWTVSCGPNHAIASRLCRAALENKASIAEARASFIEAAKEVDAYVEEKTLRPSKWPVSL
jgi:hypothetical protein